MGLHLGRSSSSDLGGKRGVKGRDRENGWGVASKCCLDPVVLWLLKVGWGVCFLWEDTQPYTQTENHPAAKA